jgi:hypothetical protein
MVVSPSLPSNHNTLMCPSDNVWQGEIGVRLDNHPPWSSELHQEMLDSICSCFEGKNEIHPIL